MPTLDVTDVLLSPEFCDEICYIRRKEVLPANGRVVVSAYNLETLGVIFIGTLGNDPQEADQQHASNWINVHSIVRLLDVAKGYQPDLVKYNDQTYIVRKAYNWSRYGVGFFAAECELQDLTSGAPR